MADQVPVLFEYRSARACIRPRKTVPQENDDSRAVVRQRSGVAAVSCVVQLLYSFNMFQSPIGVS